MNNFLLLSWLPISSAKGIKAHAYPDTDAILDSLGTVCEAGDVVVILSNGGFDGIHERLLALLGQAA